MSDPRFKAAEYMRLAPHGFKGLIDKYEIIQDQVTGVSYCTTKTNWATTTFPIIDLDGKPWVDPTFKKE